VVKIQKSDIEINNNWLNDAGQDDADLWKAVSSSERCPPPSSPPPYTTNQLITGQLCLNGK
jgi:hypothetical protein